MVVNRVREIILRAESPLPKDNILQTKKISAIEVHVIASFSVPAYQYNFCFYAVCVYGDCV